MKTLQNHLCSNKYVKQDVRLKSRGGDEEMAGMGNLGNAMKF